MSLERLFLRIAITLLTFYGLMGLGILVCYIVGVNPYSASFLIFPLGFILTMIWQKKHLDGNLKMRMKDWVYCCLFFLFVVVGIIASKPY